MSNASTDPNKVTVEIMTLGRTLGEAAGDAVGKAADIRDVDAYRAMVDMADDNLDNARANYGVDALDPGLAQGFGGDFIDSFNRAYFDGYIERVRRMLDDLG